MVFMSVVLPAPLRPTTPYRRPRRSSSVVSFSKRWPPPYIIRRLVTCTNAPPSASDLGPLSTSSATPSKTLSSTAFSPKAASAEPSEVSSRFSATGRSSSSIALSAAALVGVSMQHERTTTLMYSASGPGKSAAAISLSTRSVRSLPLAGGGSSTSTSFRSTPLTPRSPGCANMMPSTPSSSSALSTSPSAISPAETSSAKHAEAASPCTFFPEAFAVRRTCNKACIISPLAFGPLCSRSFQSRVAIRRNSASLSVLAMKMEDSNRCLWRTDKASNDRKSCPNLTASPNRSHK
mmetsp:Transcript_134112/g.388215  ORF Transcript_134112/g.388215 Transcript_134112/m.388215 type:complete len:293 (-) Transcript_134112:2002-2880(-)